MNNEWSAFAGQFSLQSIELICAEKKEMISINLKCMCKVQMRF